MRFLSGDEFMWLYLKFYDTTLLSQLVAWINM